GECCQSVWTDRRCRIQPPDARYEDADREPDALDERAFPYGDVSYLGDLHERHQRRSFDAASNAFSMIERSSSRETSPSTRRPLTNKVGVAKTPSATAWSASASTSGPNRRSSTHRAKAARSRPRALA